MKQLRNLRGPIIRRHPLTGEAIEPLGVVGNRVVWPIMGGSGTDPVPTPPAPAPTPPVPAPTPPAPAPQPTPPAPAPTPSPDDLGFPKDTPIAEMTDAQQAAYWKHQSRKHESTWKAITGDRSAEDVKNDLAEYQRLQQEKLTPSEKAIQEAEQRGRQAALADSSGRAAKVIFQAALEQQGHKDEDVTELVDSIDLSKFIVDGDVDTNKLSTFAKRFTPAGTADTGRRRDIGAGHRGTGEVTRGAAGRAEAEKRFGKKQEQSTT